MRRGFTILETLFAAGVLLIVLMAVIEILPSASLASKRADQQMTADALAQGKLEASRVAPYASLAPSSEDVPLNGTRYHVDTAVGPPPAALGTSHAKQVVVTVSWQDPGPVPSVRELRAQLYISEVGR